MNASSPSKVIWVLLLMGVFIVFVIPRLLIIDQSVTIDEEKWVTRSVNFSQALAHQTLEDTYQKEHPGVTVMLAGVLGLKSRFPSYAEWGQQQVDRAIFLSLLEQQRYVVVFLNAFVLLFVFFYIVQLFGLPTAALSILLMALSPFYASLTYVLHPDGLLSPLILLTLLSLIYFIIAHKPRDLIVSGVAAGLAWLTKSPAIVLLPMSLIIAGFAVWQDWRSEDHSVLVRRTAVSIIFWGCIAVLVFVMLWPAMWVEPIEVLRRMVETNLSYAQEGHSCAVFFDGLIYDNGQIPFSVMKFYPITYLWRTTPIVLIGLPFALWGYWRNISPYDKQRTRFTAIILLLFVALFTLFMALGSKKFDRYLLPIYPPLFILSGTGWICVLNWLRERPLFKLSGKLVWVGILCIAFVQLLSLGYVFPYYYSYYNSVLGTTRAQEVMQFGWGEGLDMPASYLNEKENAEDLTVATWYFSSFSYFFRGTTIALPCQVDPETEVKVLDADYVVIYGHQWQRNVPENILEILQKQQPEEVFAFNGLEYARIYSFQDER